jgi:CHASE3 domain sensor protein
VTDKSAKEDYLQPFNTASDEIKRIIKRVLNAEKDKIYLQRPHIMDDLINIIKEEIK